MPAAPARGRGAAAPCEWRGRVACSKSRRKIRLKLSPQAERYARRDAPRESRLMAARGALPLPPLELATVLFALMHDPDAEVEVDRAREPRGPARRRARRRCSRDRRTPPLLSHLAHAFREQRGAARADRAEPGAADDATIAFLAGLPFKRVVDIVSNNQERMVRAPEIVEALGGNPLTGRAVIDRILSFLGRPGPPARTRSRDSGARSARARREAALRAVLGDELGDFAREPGRGARGRGQRRRRRQPLRADPEDDGVPEDQARAPGQQGSARACWSSDRNKVVAIAAISSPKITDQRGDRDRPVAQRAATRCCA